MIDTRALALKDVTAIGILSASPGLDDTIAAYATVVRSTRGRSSPRPSAYTRSAPCSPASVPKAQGPARRSTSIHVSPAER